MAGIEQALSQGMGWAFGTVFLAGIATSLTPCVYPMIPITVSLFGARDAQHRSKALLLASCYVGGIALTYATLGVLAGLSGWASGSLLASRAFVVPLAALFVLMASSMFGLWKIHLPHALTNRLAMIGGRGYLGALAMGLVGGVLIAPCTGPVLAGLLLYVARTRNVWLGGSLLFTYALGIGVLFWLIAVFAVKLPRSGRWMEVFQSVLGVGLLVAALYYLQNVVDWLSRYSSTSWTFVLMNGVLLILGLGLGALHLSFSRARWGRSLRKGLGIALISLGAFGLVNAAYPPKSDIQWLKDENRALQLGYKSRRPVLIDFWASWCVPCRQMEVEVLSDPGVRRELQRFVLLKVDVTHDTDADRALKRKYRAEELPQLVLLNSKGQLVRRLGKQDDPKALAKILKAVR